MPKLSIATVTFNSQDTIKSCIESVIKNTDDFEYILVDNNSSDQTIDIIRSFKDKVKLISLDQNLGFSKANNLAVKEAKGDYFIFLNPDSQILNKGDLNELVSALESKPKHGLIGPKFVYPDDCLQKTVRNLPTIKNAFLEYILGKKGSYDFYIPNSDSISDVQTVVGACMVINKDLFNKVGGFSEKFFLYYEDIDLCQKVLKTGLKVGYYPRVVVQHVVGQSAKSNNQVSAHLVRSAKTYHGWIEFYLIQLIMRFSNLFHKN